ncbi:MAG: VWA domain-containing protein [Candidatus Electrothrix sp. AS4_5]|nr:VWA domain-containing protein [Candidatus Electrothrix gigas]
MEKKNYWWLLLLLLIPLLFTLPHCKQDNNYNIINKLNTSALIILVDKSGSMKATLSKVKTNIKDELEKIYSKSSIFTSKYIDIIFFDAASYPAFGKLEKLSQDSINKLMPFVEAQNASGGTCINSAFMKAIEEIKEYGKPTTILLLTDGEDECLDEIFKIDKKNIPKIILDSKTPRFIGLDSPQLGPEQEQIKNLREERLRKLSGHFNGSFGTQK